MTRGAKRCAARAKRRGRGSVVGGSSALGLLIALSSMVTWGCRGRALAPPPRCQAGALRVLFIRGGAGTGGFVGGGADEELSDVANTNSDDGNHGFGELCLLLAADGFGVDQAIEGPVRQPSSVDLSAIGLDRYAVVFFASNNAKYSQADAGLVADFVRRGGGALFVSDGNWGSYWDRAPTSDQTFLTQFGLLMNQDHGIYAVSGSDLLAPAHPILDGVTAFDGEGVSPCTLTHDPQALAVPVRLAAAQGLVHRNTAPNGPLTPATDDDASLVVAEYGSGRVACHFDRNTFFNENGAGTSLHRLSNTTYARNLFAWLAHRR